MTAPSDRAALYAERIRTALIPARMAVEKQIAKVEYERAEYEDLAQRLQMLAQRNGAAETTMMELGAGVWVDAVVPDTSKVLIDLGFDIHLELPLNEASSYAEKRTKMLGKRRDVLEEKRSQINWQIEQFEGAIIEARSASGAA